MRTLIVTAYTPGYADLADRLRASCDALGLGIIAMPYNSDGDWVRNGHIKPWALEKAMSEYPLRPVCWVDADAVIRSLPVELDRLAESGAGVAYHRAAKTGECLSGTVFTRSRKFVRAWSEWLEENPKEWDQKGLFPALSRSEASFAPLPAEYCWIDTFAEPRFGGPRTPVIEHFQASREVRAGTRKM